MITMRTVYQHIESKNGAITSPGKVHVREKLAGARGMRLSGSGEIKALNAALILLAQDGLITFNKAGVTITGKMGTDAKYDSPITRDANGDQIFFGAPPVVTLSSGGDLQLSAPRPALPNTEATPVSTPVIFDQDPRSAGSPRSPNPPTRPDSLREKSGDSAQPELAELRQHLGRRTMAGPVTARTRAVNDEHVRRLPGGNRLRSGGSIPGRIDMSDVVFKLEDTQRELTLSRKTNTELRHQLSAQDEAHRTELARRDEAETKLREQIAALQDENFALDTTVAVLTGERDEAIAQSHLDDFEAKRAREHEEELLHELETAQTQLENLNNQRAISMAAKLTSNLRSQVSGLEQLRDNQVDKIRELERQLVILRRDLEAEQEINAETRQSFLYLQAEVEALEDSERFKKLEAAASVITNGQKLLDTFPVSCGCHMTVIADKRHGFTSRCKLIIFREQPSPLGQPNSISIADQPATTPEAPRHERRGQVPRRKKRR